MMQIGSRRRYAGFLRLLAANYMVYDMESLVDTLMQKLSGEALSQVSQHVGADPDTTQQALTTALPLLVSGLAKNASQPQGASALHQALSADHNGSILDNTAGHVANPNTQAGHDILGHIFGNGQSQVEQAIAEQTGLQPAQVGELMAIAAPLVLGYLGRQQHQQGLDPQGLAGLLGEQQQMAQSSQPGVIGLIGQLLGGRTANQGTNGHAGAGSQGGSNIRSGGQTYQA
jgi:hypothetical protein